MKKIVAVSLLAFAFYSCGNSTKTTDATVDVDVKTEKADEHTSQNSLDYMGTYIGALPTANGEGMKVTLKLEKDTYTRDIEYIGKKDSKFSNQGNYTWNEAGNTIILGGIDAKAEPTQYFVGENRLIQLDMKGEKITGDLADKYILLKEGV